LKEIDFNPDYSYLLKVSDPIYPDCFSSRPSRENEPIQLLLVSDGEFSKDLLMNERDRLNLPGPALERYLSAEDVEYTRSRNKAFNRGFFAIEEQISPLAFYFKSRRVSQHRILNELDINQNGATYELLTFHYPLKLLEKYKNFIYYTRKLTNIIWKFGYYEFPDLIEEIRQTYPEFFVPDDELEPTHKKKHRARRKYILQILESLNDSVRSKK